ncbi:MAG TPA: energy transducer TonB [Saprospiraceae bacterium]|nr:energy transducer TonB [Saprospiraceae bacterium]
MKKLPLFLFLFCLCAFPSMAQNKKVFSHVEKMPSFPGGVEAMYKFIYTNIKYPAKARMNRISGQVTISFYVNEEGYLKDISVIKGPGSGLDEEAMRVVELMNEDHRWNPGMHDGKKVPVAYTLPIKFVIQ